jgi:hypothetical protein
MVCIRPADVGLSGGSIFLQVINLAAASIRVFSGSALCDAIFPVSFILMSVQASSFPAAA